MIRNVTSRSLGSLAPGYAATGRGYIAYVALVGDIGLVLLALSAEIPWLILLTTGLFVGGSIAVLRGEVATYCALKR